MLRNHLASFAPVTFLFASGCDSGGSSLSPAPTPTPSPAMGGSEATGAGAGSTNGEAPGNGNAAATLTERPSNSSCLAFAKPTENSDVKLERHFTAAGFPEITGCQQAPQNKRFYSVRRTGQINSFTKDDASDQSVFMDISGSINSGPGEGGLLGMAWHPTRK
ncbi:MAG: hypothetical protein H7318_00160, partial [Oligoflexus sp.]|nr:hypothetical protein [Oligoflexus sp.]